MMKAQRLTPNIRVLLIPVLIAEIAQRGVAVRRIVEPLDACVQVDCIPVL